MIKEDFDFYTIKQITEILQISRLTIYKFIETWKLKSYKFWKSHRIKKEDFEEFLQDHKQ
jgi:excisionase family DNA binding protein